MSFAFYTQLQYEDTIVSSTSAMLTPATKYKKNNLIDDLLDSLWAPSNTTGTKDMIFKWPAVADDLEAVVLWIQNYSTNFSTMTLQLAYSANGTDWTNLGSTHYVLHELGPLFIYDLTTEEKTEALNKQWWKLSLASLPAIPVLGKVMLCHKHDISELREWPLSDTPTYFNNAITSRGGSKMVKTNSQQPTEQLTANIFARNATDIEHLEDFFNDVRGSLVPFIFRPDTSFLTARMCRLDSDRAKWVDIGYQKRKYSFEMLTLDYLPPTETY